MSKTKIEDFTACLIYGACQIGMTINADDIALHTLIAVSEYAAKMLNVNSKSNDVEPMSFSQLRNSGITKG